MLHGRGCGNPARFSLALQEEIVSVDDASLRPLGGEWEERWRRLAQDASCRQASRPHAASNLIMVACVGARSIHERQRCSANFAEHGLVDEVEFTRQFLVWTFPRAEFGQSSPGSCPAVSGSVPM